VPAPDGSAWRSIVSEQLDRGRPLIALIAVAPRTRL